MAEVKEEQREDKLEDINVEGEASEEEDDQSEDEDPEPTFIPYKEAFHPTNSAELLST